MIWLFLVLISVPVLEIALFIKIGGWLGLWPTLVLVILTALAGTFMLRSQGLAAIQEIQSNLERLKNPAVSLAHGVFILISGLLLLTPGFFTDSLGFALLIPFVRSALINWFKNRVEFSHTAYTDFDAKKQDFSDAESERTDHTLDGEYFEIDEDLPRPTHKPSSGWTRH